MEWLQRNKNKKIISRLQKLRAKLLQNSFDGKLTIHAARDRVRIINKMIEKKYWEGRV